MDGQDDSSFIALPACLRHRIDGAFDAVASSQSEAPVEEPEPRYEAGGFIVEDILSADSYIPLPEIPRALSLLDLSPDEDIMGVFKNAAAGWGAQNAHKDRVNKKDWRAVCAVLLEGEPVGGSDEEDLVAAKGTDSGPDSAEYQMEELLDETESEDSTDEYEEIDTRLPRARKAQKVPPETWHIKDSSKEISRQLTESQRAQCRQEFSRFLPHIPDNELDRQRIMIKDIARVADLLKENLKTKEMLEMLEVFSTSPDKSMNLADFEHMMLLTKLV